METNYNEQDSIYDIEYYEYLYEINLLKRKDELNVFKN